MQFPASAVEVKEALQGFERKTGYPGISCQSWSVGCQGHGGQRQSNSGGCQSVSAMDMML